MAAIVPIYNGIVRLQIVQRPSWWVLLFVIRAVPFVVAIIVMIDLAKRFGQALH